MLVGVCRCRFFHRWLLSNLSPELLFCSLRAAVVAGGFTVVAIQNKLSRWCFRSRRATGKKKKDKRGENIGARAGFARAAATRKREWAALPRLSLAISYFSPVLLTFSPAGATTRRCSRLVAGQRAVSLSKFARTSS